MGQPIDKITLRGFKSIRNLEDFPLRNLNIIIGANGAGKSNFVSFFTFLREGVEQRLSFYVTKNGGADIFLFMGPKVTISMDAKLRFHSCVYAFELTSTADIRFVFVDEFIGYRSVEKSVRKGSIRQGREVSTWTESILKERSTDAQLPDMDKQVCKDIYDSISKWVVYHFHDTSMRAAMRRECRVRDNEYLRPDGENLAAFLLMLRDEHPGLYKKVRDTVRLAAPFFDDFKLRPKPSNGDMMLQLEWTQKGSDYPFHVSQLSDGTLRFIALTTALLQRNPPATILFDEPELGLHPYALNLFAGLVKKAAAKTQVIVSTQSAPLLDNFEAEDIIVVERKEGASTFERLSSDKLAEWLKDYSLGELWQKNVIGGRPSDD
jgi:predicted ATPase